VQEVSGHPPGAAQRNRLRSGREYHIAGNVPYTRYFLATISSSSSSRAVPRSGIHRTATPRSFDLRQTRPLARNWQDAGDGQSRPWPQGPPTLHGEKQMDATAILTTSRVMLDDMSSHVIKKASRPCSRDAGS